MRGWWLACVLLLAIAGASRAEETEKMELAVGAKAPDFRLNDHEGTARSLAEARKEAWVVLAFFPKADTPG